MQNYPKLDLNDLTSGIRSGQRSGRVRCLNRRNSDIAFSLSYISFEREGYMFIGYRRHKWRVGLIADGNTFKFLAPCCTQPVAALYIPEDALECQRCILRRREIELLKQGTLGARMKWLDLPEHTLSYDESVKIWSNAIHGRV